MKKRQGPTPVPVEERLWKYIIPEPNSGCWLWIGTVNNKGYGVIGVGSRYDHTDRKKLAHVVCYELYVGPIPPGLELDHKCRITFCCNPHHVEPVTHRVNLLRGVGFAAQKAAQTHCINGHEFSERNTYITKLKQRKCKACYQDRRRRYRREQIKKFGIRIW